MGAETDHECQAAPAGRSFCHRLRSFGDAHFVPSEVVSRCCPSLSGPAPFVQSHATDGDMIRAGPYRQIARNRVDKIRAQAGQHEAECQSREVHGKSRLHESDGRLKIIHCRHPGRAGRTSPRADRAWLEVSHLQYQRTLSTVKRHERTTGITGVVRRRDTAIFFACFGVVFGRGDEVEHGARFGEGGSVASGVDERAETRLGLKRDAEGAVRTYRSHFG